MFSELANGVSNPKEGDGQLSNVASVRLGEQNREEKKINSIYSVCELDTHWVIKVQEKCTGGQPVASDLHINPNARTADLDSSAAIRIAFSFIGVHRLRPCKSLSVWVPPRSHAADG